MFQGGKGVWYFKGCFPGGRARSILLSSLLIPNPTKVTRFSPGESHPAYRAFQHNLSCQYFSTYGRWAFTNQSLYRIIAPGNQEIASGGKGGWCFKGCFPGGRARSILLSSLLIPNPNKVTHFSPGESHPAYRAFQHNLSCQYFSTYGRWAFTNQSRNPVICPGVLDSTLHA